MKRASLAIGVIGITLLTTLVVGGTATAACVEPSPNPTQGTSEVSVQIGEPAATPTPSNSCAPTPGVTPTPTPSPRTTAVPGENRSPGNGVGVPRRPRTPSIQLATETPQTAPAGAPGAPVPSSRPSDDAAELKLEPTRVEAGSKIQATASGFTPGEQVQLVLYPNPLIIGSYAADATGALSIVFEVPKDTRTGKRVAEVTGWASDTKANGEFVVTAAPDVAGGVPTIWWLLGILLLLLIAAIAVAISLRSSIASVFVGPRTTEAVS